MKSLLMVCAIFCLTSTGHCDDWEKPHTTAGVTEWSVTDSGPILRLSKEKSQSGPIYKLNFVGTDGQVKDVGMLGPNTWIDNSWAGLAWLPEAKFASLGDRYIFFNSDLFLAIFDMKNQCFVINNQTEFLVKIGDFRWFYVVYRGKNSFANSDVLGIVGADLLQKTNVVVPSGFDDVAMINRVGRSVVLDGLLIAPPIPDRNSTWLLLASHSAHVTIQQLKIPSLEQLSSMDVTKSIPNVDILIKQSREGSIPEMGTAILRTLIPNQDILPWDKASDGLLDVTK